MGGDIVPGANLEALRAQYEAIAAAASADTEDLQHEVEATGASAHIG